MKTLALSCPNTGRSWRVQVLVPASAPPPAGYPVLYMLDGDWTMPALLQRAPDVLHNAIIVAIGYGLNPEAIRQARAYDYTPALPEGQDNSDPRVPQWRSGGAPPFLEFLETPSCHSWKPACR